MTGRLIIRLFRIPRMGIALAVDRFIVPVVLRLHGAVVGKGCRFNGMPVVRTVRGGDLILGDGVLINSRQYSNSATMLHRTVLSVLRPGAAIVLGAGVGLSGVSIVATTRVEIGENTLVGSGAVIWDTDFHPLDPRQRRVHPTRGAASAAIDIGRDVFIGARAMILKGVTIGNGVVVGAGAVVTRDVPAGAVVAGNPAQIVGGRQGSGNE